MQGTCRTGARRGAAGEEQPPHPGRLPVGEEIDRGGDKAGRLDGPHTDRFSQIAADGSG